MSQILKHNIDMNDREKARETNGIDVIDECESKQTDEKERWIAGRSRQQRQGQTSDTS